MMPPEGSVHCWVVWSSPRKWKAFHHRREARAYAREVNGVLYKLVRTH